MSYGDPNNPYGQPPQQPPAAPGYGYPQAPPGVPPQQGYGYPQQPPAYPGYPGGNMMQQSMPGLLVTARVFLFLISAVQILFAIIYLYVGAIASDAGDSGEDLGLTGMGEAGDAVAGIAIVGALIAGGLAVLSIMLGVKFSRGGQGVRITTVVYGALGGIVGLIMLFIGLDSGLATAIIGPLIWVTFAVIITIAPVVPSGTAWFNRPRY
ncbi:hypothetical protein GCM10010277_59990 [Streptomyces longisporoflavus]|uniref:hypothetical protein n=1 Tax=Streptomyces longisporoflavus TaxID=28044 RepID=UPI00167E37BE|nr:hypothetical protein [Streptomyces longisporoflavus]GGV57763.1 hypothetical protein GCM10010277_59990 [Streptomyces longisporoflavus]